MRVKVGDGNRKALQSRKDQITNLLAKLNSENPILVIGDLNYGPHRIEYAEFDKNGNKIGLNWQEIIYEIRDHQKYKLFAPKGYSYKATTLDWLLTKGIKVVEKSDYNQFDRSFEQYNKKSYVKEHSANENYFIPTGPGCPDHAIFTVEIEVN